MGAIHGFFSSHSIVFNCSLCCTHAQLGSAARRLGVRFWHIEENNNWQPILFIWVAKIRSNAHIRAEEPVIKMLYVYDISCSAGPSMVKQKKNQVLGLSPLSWCPAWGGQLWQTIRTLTVNQGDSVSSPFQNCHVFVRKFKKYIYHYFIIVTDRGPDNSSEGNTVTLQGLLLYWSVYIKTSL